MEIDPKLPKELLLDEVRMRQILFNLVGNALKFTHEGYIKLSVQKSFTKEDESSLELIFTVEDTGIGISPDQADSIFDAFRQQKSQDPGQYGGTGLGLSITKRLVEIMGGEISLKSEVDKGSIFKVQFCEIEVPSITPTSLPMERVRLPEIASKSERPLRFQDTMVLVVDDVESNRVLVKEFLQSVNISTLEAENGEQAVRYAREFKPDLIIMDIRMPIMDGLEAIRIIKSTEELKHIPIVVLTASAMKDQENEIKKANCEGFLKKPINRNELITELIRFFPYSREDNSEKDSDQGNQDNIDDETKEILPEILDILNIQMMKEWEKITDIFIIDDVEDFAQKIKDMGTKYRLKKLKDWGNKLFKEIQSYDMENAPITLQAFPELILSIANLGKRENQ